MRRFAELYERLDSTTSTLAKVDAMSRYFESAPPADAAWAVFFLSGRRFKRLLAPGQLRPWALEATGLPEWLFVDAYAAVGDLAETLTLLLADEEAGDPELIDLPLHRWIEERIHPLRELDDEAQRRQVLAWFRSLPREQLFILAKMLTGGLRVGVSQTLTVRALAQVAGVEPAALHHRLMGHWIPSADFFEALLDPDVDDADLSRPYPFFLASPVEMAEGQDIPAHLGELDAWQVEWKWDGIRGQLIRRGGETFLWSRGEELVTDRYPEIAAAAESLPDGTVLDGEILAWAGQLDTDPTSAVLPFAVLQKRIGRKKPGKKILADAPVNFLAYDLLEADGRDGRPLALHERRARLEEVTEGLFPTSPTVHARGWRELDRLRQESRDRGVEGFMLKSRESPYRTGRKKGDWWKWKVDPLTADAVLVYAQAGHGKRATLLTDYTFAVWKGDALVPIAKAYSGLDDAEIRRLDRWLRRHTRERFGPVRSVEPVQVFELAFEGIRRSSRHKSGIAVRFPRIQRWREDLTPEDADTLEQVMALLPAGEA
ncbi:MAG: ATP-dependent DNA ligase [Holophagales bacterium]|nr:ATP-dependent DNA ligase [Holophagales bacterium]